MKQPAHTGTSTATSPAADPGRLRGFAHLPFRKKLLLMVLLPLLGVLPLLGAFLLGWANVGMQQLLLTKVRSDLAVAQGYFDRVLAEVGASTTGLAESAALLQALQAGADPGPLLQGLAQREHLDFIELLPTDTTATEGTRIEVLEPAQQSVFSPALRERVAVPLVRTRNAAPTQRQVEDRALVLLSTRAVRDGRGVLLARLRAGVLLNRNLDFIDHINAIVYPEGSLPLSNWGSRGTATLFLDDVRISTNVRLFGTEKDQRAIGTRVSQTVRDSVLGQGSTWLDRAFVVNEWFVSAYQPLADGQGRRVGMLYVGILERPFAWLKYGALASIGLLFFAVMVAAAWVSLRWARGIFRPLEQMEETMARVEAGALQARVGAVDSADEIGRLAGHLDHLLEVIDQNTRQLDRKVAERTQALALAQQQLVRSEKLATVGQLTASIAHEVNNPIAVIQGNLDLLRELIGAPACQAAAAELKLVDEQLERMRLIVTRLLQFARPSEFAGYTEPVDTAQVLDDCLVLAEHQIRRSSIRVQRDYRATGRPELNRQELQQVLVNLIVNATLAMQAGAEPPALQNQGSLLLSTRDIGDSHVEVEVGDSGPGLSEVMLARLFQPFVTSRSDGTGLGLWISRGLVERYGGDIRAANRLDGPGAVFTVVLRLVPQESGGPDQPSLSSSP